MLFKFISFDHSFFGWVSLKLLGVSLIWLHVPSLVEALLFLHLARFHEDLLVRQSHFVSPRTNFVLSLTFYINITLGLVNFPRVFGLQNQHVRVIRIAISRFRFILRYEIRLRVPPRVISQRHHFPPDTRCFFVYLLQPIYVITESSPTR